MLHCTISPGQSTVGRCPIKQGLPFLAPAWRDSPCRTQIVFLEFFDEVDHFDGAGGDVEAFVAGFCASPFDGLFDVFRRDDAKHDGDARFEGCLGDTFSRFAADQVIVAGSAADDGTEADDGVVFARFGHFLGDQGDFKSTRDSGRRDVCVVDTVAMESVISAAEELAADEFVETCDDDAEFRTRTD